MAGHAELQRAAKPQAQPSEDPEDRNHSACGVPRICGKRSATWRSNSIPRVFRCGNPANGRVTDTDAIDVLAERLYSTRGALHKTLHDARRKLRRGARGFDVAHSDRERAMNDERTAALIAALLGPPGAELTCDQCFEQLDAMSI